MSTFLSRCSPLRGERAPPRSTFLAMLFACLVVGLASCGGSEAPGAGEPGAEDAEGGRSNAGPGTACDVLPATAVEAVLGQAVSPNLALNMAAPEGTGSLSQCNYDTENEPAVASLMLRPNRPGESPASVASSVREAMAEANGELQDVPNLGDTAFWSDPQLHVFVEGWYLIVTPTAAGGIEEARALAERAIDRL